MSRNSGTLQVSPATARKSLLWLAAVLVVTSIVNADVASAQSGDMMGPKRAARLLTQATFGPTQSEIARLSSMSAAEYVDQQLAMPPTLHLPECRALANDKDGINERSRVDTWWKLSLTAPDQLRQRVALALSEIMVVSDGSGLVGASEEGLCHYYDILLANAFGNYRQLLEEVTLSPQMGRYLSMFRNRKPNPVIGRRADENFAREVMQLFSLGTVLLNADGTPVLDGTGDPIDTYTQDDIQGLARVFTGWSWAGAQFDGGKRNWLVSMQGFDTQHDLDAKTIVGGATVPAGGSAVADLATALDTLFRHPNAAPFISRQLIQKLVTSNPSPAYVASVAAVFANNGSGVRGDLRAVLRAILLHREARLGLAANANFGKVREPLLRQAHLWRALQAQSALNGRYSYRTGNRDLGQQVQSASSVFNFFSPGYAPSGDIRDAGLVTPEYQLATESRLATSDNLLYQSVYNDYLGHAGISPSAIRVDLSALVAAAPDVSTLLDRVDLLLMSGQMDSGFRSILAQHLQAIPFASDRGLARAQDAVYLVMVSPQYLVQR